ncbi:MAG: prepilin-type N-terminal cleavage/methylation domain-containing protein [Phycisphaerae bacterium]|jgi:type II secretory pathway component PulJ
MKQQDGKYNCDKKGFTPIPIYIVRANGKSNGIANLSTVSLRYRCANRCEGFTLAEAMATLVIAAMIMVAVVGIYTGVRRAESAINSRIKSGHVATEILQRIAEDIDGLALPGSDVTMTIKNKLDIDGFKITQMIIENKIYDKDNKPQTFEKIVWQSRVDMDSNGLIIFRAHSGYALEDKMLEETKEKYERELFIPVCRGATLFSIEVMDGNTVIENWENPGLPPDVKISVSFAERTQDVLGDMAVPAESIKTRMVVINRFRQIPYQFIEKEIYDANKIADMNLPDEPNETADINEASASQKKEPNEPLRR